MFYSRERERKKEPQYPVDKITNKKRKKVQKECTRKFTGMNFAHQRQTNIWFSLYGCPTTQLYSFEILKHLWLGIEFTSGQRIKVTLQQESNHMKKLMTNISKELHHKVGCYVDDLILQIEQGWPSHSRL
jgi:hypothetical protein